MAVSRNLLIHGMDVKMNNLNEKIETNNAKVRAGRKLETPQGAAFERDRFQRKIERANRLFYTITFFALVAFIAGAVYGWGDFINKQIVGMK